MKFLCVSFIFCLSACTSHKEELAGHKKETMNTIKVSEAAQDIKLPRNLFKELEKELADEFKTVAPVFVFIPLQVQFTEKEDQKVLKDSPLYFHFEKGGGQIDLKEVVDGTGSFYMNFPAEQFSETSELIHLYYISQSPVKKIGDESFGLGCGKWVDMKSSFKKLQQSHFLKLNTSMQRHLHVLAGHYVFVFKQTNQIYLTQLTISDSRFTNELCTSLEKSAGDSK